LRAPRRPSDFLSACGQHDVQAHLGLLPELDAIAPQVNAHWDSSTHVRQSLATSDFQKRTPGRPSGRDRLREVGPHRGASIKDLRIMVFDDLDSPADHDHS
jgi:hypothetical protein